MSDVGTFVCSLFSLICLGAALLPGFLQWRRRHSPSEHYLSAQDTPATTARKLERRCQQLADARYRLRTRAAELRGLKWEMEQLGAQSPMEASSTMPTLGQQLYKNRITKLDEEIYKLRVCESLAQKMLETAKLTIEMLAVEAHVEEVMPELMGGSSDLAEQFARYRELEAAFEDVKLRALAADEVAGLLGS
jgi:hypothetical protein